MIVTGPGLAETAGHAGEIVGHGTVTASYDSVTVLRIDPTRYASVF